MITSFNVSAADNGFTLSYCIKTKKAIATGSYDNCIYDDKQEVFMKKDSDKLLARVSELLGVISKDVKVLADDDEETLPAIKG